MNQIPVVIEKLINDAAQKLPRQRYVYQDSVIMTGAELKLSAFDEHKRGKELIDDKYYNVPIPGFGEVNHRRRMRHAYQEKGIEGVTAYIDRFIVREPIVAPSKRRR